MSTQEKKWPGLSVSDSDNEIITRIRSAEGILKSIDIKDLLMIAAAIAVKKDAPELTTKQESLTRQIMHPTLMAKQDYSEYRQYIALIFYITNGHNKLENMSDVSTMVKNFIDYAQRGLRLLEALYLNQKDGSDALMQDFAVLLSKH